MSPRVSFGRGAALLSALALLGAAAPCAAQEGRLALYPSRFTLDSAVDAQRVAVVFTAVDGVTRDVTAEAEFAPSEPGMLTLDGDVVRGIRPGRLTLEARWSGGVAAAEIEVRDPLARPPVSFRNDVMPVLMRAGCNAGSCHGAKAGKNGFGLSLFGFAPDRDFVALTRDLCGRRIDCADPDASLALLKPLGEVRHKGGVRFATGDPLHSILRAWIAEGAADDGDAAPELTSIELAPPELVLQGAGTPARVLVTARYADGSSRDVTRLAILSTSSEPTVAVDVDGRVVAGAQRGEAHVMARFGPFAEVTPVIVLPADAVAIDDLGVAPVNEIDELAFAKLRKLRLRPAPLCDDQTFVRRVYLDLAGRLPAVAEVEGFVAERDPDKREHLIDLLLAGPEFAALTAAQWEDVLRIERDRLEDKGAYLWTRWLRESLADGVPFDELVRRMLTASGSSFAEPPASFYVAAQDPKVLAENTAQTFLGIRLQCAQCHDHPFERWRMDDYYGFAAFFGQVTRKGGEHPDETIIYHRGSGSVRNERTGQVAEPRFLGGEAAQIARGADPREALAAWLTSPDNPWFAANVANRLWARLFGRGIVEPVDDVRVSNPPSHPELHRWLGRRLAASGFDLRGLAREICLSHTYQAAEHPDALPAEVLAGRVPRRLAAEQLLDAISAVTGVSTKLRGVPAGESASAAVGGDVGSRFLELFGRPKRDSVCACERRSEPTLNQVLHLINGDTIDAKIAAKDGWLASRLGGGVEPQALLDELFLRCYARRPTDGERARLLAEVPTGDDARAFWEDMLWAVLNSKEFLFQH
ncbi:MAG: DUF1549 domain-containing protein [Planctomycetes bacterium]|nr:DUF1549 domain-containing protein [Planctomycetota bacterium]